MNTQANLLPFAMVVLGGVAYHLAQKSMPKGIDPFVPLTVAFALAALGSLAIAMFNGGAGRANFARVNWAAVVLALSVIAIEGGYLIAYRQGWRISVASLACNATVAILLLIIGVMVYREKITAQNAGGMALCAVGLYLLKG